MRDSGPVDSIDSAAGPLEPATIDHQTAQLVGAQMTSIVFLRQLSERFGPISGVGGGLEHASLRLVAALLGHGLAPSLMSLCLPGNGEAVRGVIQIEYGRIEDSLARDPLQTHFHPFEMLWETMPHQNTVTGISAKPHEKQLSCFVSPRPPAC